MLNPDTSCFENSVEQDQLASEKPADQGLHYFSLIVNTVCKLIVQRLGGGV